MNKIFERYEELTGEIYEFGQLGTEEKNKEYSKLENEIKQSIRLKELIKEQIKFQRQIGNNYENSALARILKNLIEESEKKS